ncbi:GIY-YIG nuclease family protein [Aliiglaciecola sp. 2_MG-2023]|uniref:GIY-YIG nuclease family protein n=1 Tax=unclassified Aliiglaciecola TaxID=2593648 RepID=UPI0026E1D1FE|nr:MULTISPECIES: GIY-YIG nuclease family protein [unclassified Aliiglaciecola]MDO6712790.1 GIY-YIG nuclease family protein [Aliiglaciecola sp. 2_MG-2023]MDO6753811.1 GIY-YIG nuclease family protein [Aliiglaciecola sp. 1_MG-2023]
MSNKLTFFDLLKTYGVNSSEVRLVRHGNKEIDVLKTFLNETQKFTEYTAWQKSGKYGDAKYLAIFSPARGTTSLFLGLWKVKGVTANKDLEPKHLALLQKYRLPERWYEKSVRYDLELSSEMLDLNQRLVIDWGGSTVSWVQRKNKSVVEIRPINSIGEFSSYDSILLSYADLQKLISDSDSNATWVNALSSVNGVYLIKHIVDGRLYIGSAYGKGGILGRWGSYARTGHAGNKLLKFLDPSNFVFSILEISPSTMSADDVIARENRWKVCLGTREFGLNDN